MSQELAPANDEQLKVLGKALNQCVEDMLARIDPVFFTAQQLQLVKEAMLVNATRMVNAGWVKSEADAPEEIVEQFRWNTAWVINMLAISDTFADSTPNEDGSMRDNIDLMINTVVQLLNLQVNPIGAGFRPHPNWNGEES